MVCGLLILFVVLIHLAKSGPVSMLSVQLLMLKGCEQLHLSFQDAISTEWKAYRCETCVLNHSCREKKNCRGVNQSGGWRSTFMSSTFSTFIHFQCSKESIERCCHLHCAALVALRYLCSVPTSLFIHACIMYKCMYCFIYTILQTFLAGFQTGIRH